MNKYEVGFEKLGLGAKAQPRTMNPSENPFELVSYLKVTDSVYSDSKGRTVKAKK